MNVPRDNEDAAYFADAIARHCDVYHAHFGDRLRAVYVWGSVHRGEAVRGVSDLDLQVFTKDALTPDDDTWLRDTRRTLDAAFPGVAGLVRPFPESALQTGAPTDVGASARAVARALAFRCRYDATLVWGQDIAAQVDAPRPDARFARDAFPAVYDLARFAAGRDLHNRTDFSLPTQPSLLLRKLARLAVLGGAYLLMAHEQYTSFRGRDVLAALQPAVPTWGAFLEDTGRWYIVPIQEMDGTLDAYREHLADWVGYVNEQLVAVLPG